MARPKRTQTGPDARERIIDAFWDLLAECPHDRITVRALASRAHVNHNTIYRHFGAMENVAKAAVSEVYSAEASQRMFALFSHPEMMDAPHLAEQGLDERVGKAILAMRSGSPLLVTAIQEAIRERWMQMAGISWGDLPDGRKLELSFILGGVSSVLQSLRSADEIQMVKPLVAGRIGTAVRQTLAELGA